MPHNVFYTANEAYASKVPGARQMPVGVDSDFFKRDKYISKKPHSILFLSRISPIKRLDVLIEAVSILTERGVRCALSVYGDAPVRDKKYYNSVHKNALSLINKGAVSFNGGVEPKLAPVIYNEHEIYVNLTNSGSFDKTIIESVCSETITLVSNETLADDFDKKYLFKEGDALDCANKLQNLLEMNNSRKEEAGKWFRVYGLRHDIKVLIQRVIKHVR